MAPKKVKTAETTVVAVSNLPKYPEVLCVADYIFEILLDNLAQKIDDDRLRAMEVPYNIEIGLSNSLEPFTILKLVNDQVPLLKEADEEQEPLGSTKDSCCQDRYRDGQPTVREDVSSIRLEGFATMKKGSSIYSKRNLKLSPSGVESP